MWKLTASSSGRQSAHIRKNVRADYVGCYDQNRFGIARRKNSALNCDVKPLCTVKHSITRYRITLEAFHVNLGGRVPRVPFKTAKSGTRVTRPSEIGVWKTPAQMRQLAFTAAHKKLASAAVKCILSGR